MGKKKITLIKDINQILTYSAKKSKVNLALENSTLYLPTNSDSLSTKSKGVRFNSANIITIHKKKKKRKKKRNY